MTSSTSPHTGNPGVFQSILRREIDGSTLGSASSRKNTRHAGNVRTSLVKPSKDQKRPGQLLANSPSIQNLSRAPGLPAGSERRAYIAPPGSTVREPVHRSSFVMFTAFLNVDVSHVHDLCHIAEPQSTEIEALLSTEIETLYNRTLNPRSPLPPYKISPPNDGVQGWRFKVPAFGPNRNFSKGMTLVPKHEELI